MTIILFELTGKDRVWTLFDGFFPLFFWSFLWRRGGGGGEGGLVQSQGVVVLQAPPHLFS